MQPLNAIDAIAPAFTRTHEILFHKPWKLGRAWKLCATQYLGLMGGVFIPFPIFLAFLPKREGSSAYVFGLLAGLVIVTAVVCCFFYLGVRLSFVNFEMIVTRERFIAPMWRRYGRRVWPVMGAKIVLGTVLSLALLPLLIKVGRGMFAMFAMMPQPVPGQPPDPRMFGMMMQQMVSFYGVFFLVFFVLKGASTLLEDFAVPFFILEDVTFTTAIGRGWSVFAADPVQCSLYLAMKFFLSFAGFIMQYIANLVVQIPAFIVLFLTIFVGTLALHSLGTAGAVLGLIGLVVIYTAFILYAGFTGFFMIGYLFMLLEAYATYFLGGRYARLGDMLEPPLPPAYVYAPPPSFPSATERKDDEDDGPSLPMDPALV